MKETYTCKKCLHSILSEYQPSGWILCSDGEYLCDDCPNQQEYEKNFITCSCGTKVNMSKGCFDSGTWETICNGCGKTVYSKVNYNLKTHKTGAKRTTDADDERYDLISPIALEAVARIYAEGAKKYGDYNWEKGFSISDLMNHGIRHYNLYMRGDRSEDHLGKLIWAAMAAKHSEVCWPHLNKNLRGPDCIPPKEDK
jgi:hypothetical protein